MEMVSRQPSPAEGLMLLMQQPLTESIQTLYQKLWHNKRSGNLGKTRHKLSLETILKQLVIRGTY